MIGGCNVDPPPFIRYASPVMENYCMGFLRGLGQSKHTDISASLEDKNYGPAGQP